MIVDCCVILLTILFPPVGVFLVFGCGADLCINLCLTFLGYLPGHIHAFYLMATRHPARQQQYVVYTEVPSSSAPYNQPPQKNTVYPQPASHQQSGSGSYYQPPPPAYK